MNPVTPLGVRSYPPANKVGYGRCNRPGEPIFYGSVGSHAAIRELTPPTGARLALSMWRVNRLVLAVAIGYSEQVFAKLGSQRSNVWWRQDNQTESVPLGATSRENLIVDRFLAKEFTKHVSEDEKWRYKLSIAISEAYLKAPPADNVAGVEIPGLIRPPDSLTGTTVGALVYPSIATNADNDNIAIKREVSDDCLTFAWVHYVEISRKADRIDEFEIKGLDFADRLSPSGEIQWTGSFPNTYAPGSDLYLTVDGTDLVLKDSLNRIAGRLSKPDG
jgi:hypothetical protein